MSREPKAPPSSLQPAVAVTRVPTAVTAPLASGGQTLPAGVRRDMESRFAHDFSQVRIHTDEQAAQHVEALGARAVTLGQHIAFASGRYAPQRPDGQRLLAHELAHTVQQRGAMPSSAQTTVAAPASQAESQARRAADDALEHRPPQLQPQPPMLMRDGEPGMRDVVRSMRGDLAKFFKYQSRFKDLNGREIRNMLDSIAADPDGVQSLIDNFDAAAGGDIPRLRVALQAVAHKGTTNYQSFAASYAADLTTLPGDQQQAILEYLGKPAAASAAPAVPAAVPAATPAAATSAQTTFKTGSYSMSSAEVMLVRGRERSVSKRKDKEVVTPGRSALKESPEHFTAEILKLAGYEPDAWYNSFTSISFLGFTVANVHTDLATHLKSVEKTFAAQYGGDAQDPAVAGKTLGLKQDIGGARHAPTGTAISMHLFGLAIDVNYATNPWVVDDPSSKSGKDENAILSRASQLVTGTATAYKPGAMDYDQIAALNQSVKTYFSYLDDKPALEARLKDAGGSWSGKTSDDAQKQIQSDLEKLAVYWERNTDKGRDAIKAGGFMDMQKAFVDGMKLDWGGKYGDMMHFDMRNRGSGAKINAARARYQKTKIAEAEKAYTESHPE